MLLGSLLLLVATMTAAQGSGRQASKRKVAYQFKHGQCSYTFLLPSLQPCTTLGASNSTQENQPLTIHMTLLSDQQMERLENSARNSTQRLQKLEEYLQTIFGHKQDQNQKNTVQSHVAPSLELGTSLLNHTWKLTNMDSQVLNRKSSMEQQMQETLLTTDKLEKQLQEQNRTLHQLHGGNSDLETRLHTLEAEREAQLTGHQSERDKVRQQLGQQNSRLTGIQQSLEALRKNSILLQQQQRQLLQSLQLLRHMTERGPDAAVQRFRDCEDIRKSGFDKDGVYSILVPNVFCKMDTNGSAWTLIQRRENGKVNFQRNWQEYKQGFGDPAGEHWLGNEAVHQLTSSTNYSLRVELEDWEGKTFSANFEHFQLGSEEQYYRIFLDKHSGVSSRRSYPILENNNFSTRDADHDKCSCNCAEILSGGWWFGSCGISNLNGIYYPSGHHKRKMNGIRWDLSSEVTASSLRASRMMIRPLHS